MIFDILDMTTAYIQYLVLLVRIAPDTLPLFFSETLDVIKYFLLDLISAFSEEDRYTNALRVVLPDWVPLDVRLQFVIVVIIAPLAVATFGFLVVFNKVGYVWLMAVLGSLFCLCFGALLVANRDIYSDHAEPSTSVRVSLVSVGVPLCLAFSALAILSIRRLRRKTAREEQDTHDHYVEKELRHRESKTLMYELIDREHLDVDLLAAEKSRQARKRSRIARLNVLDVCLQGFMVVCLVVGGLICLGGIPVSAMGLMQGSFAMTIIGAGLFVLAGLSFVWFVLGLFSRGRWLRITVAEYLGGIVLSLLIICCTSLYTTIVTTFVSVLYCDELKCSAGSRPPYTGALFPAGNAAQDPNYNGIMVGCSACHIDAYPQLCRAEWKNKICSGTISEPRLAYDARVRCAEVDNFYRASAGLMFAVYMLFVPLLQLVMACCGVDLVRRRFPLESRVVELFTPLELFYEKVLTSKNDAGFMYNAYKPSFRYYRLSFLVQKALMALISCTTERSASASPVWIGLALFMVVPAVAAFFAILLRPFSRPTETVFFPTLQILLAVFAMVLLIAERLSHRLSFGVGVVLLLVAVAVPIMTLIVGTVLTLRMEQRRYNLLLLRLQFVMNKAASAGTRGAPGWSRTTSAALSGRGGDELKRDGVVYSSAGTCDASQLRYNWLERLVLRLVQWLDPDIGSDKVMTAESPAHSVDDEAERPRSASDDTASSHGTKDEAEAREHRGHDGPHQPPQEPNYPNDSTRTQAADNYVYDPSLHGERHSDGSLKVKPREGDEDADTNKTYDMEGLYDLSGMAEVADSTLLDGDDERADRVGLLAHENKEGERGEENGGEGDDDHAAQFIPRRERKRAVILVGSAYEEAAEATRRHQLALDRQARGDVADADADLQERAAVSYWRRCFPCFNWTHKHRSDDEKGQLFAMTGDRAALREATFSKLQRRVHEYDTAAFLFVPEAYFLRCYYPDQDGAAQGAHGRFWTLFTDLLRPTVRRFSDDAASGSPKGAAAQSPHVEVVSTTPQGRSPSRRSLMHRGSRAAPSSRRPSPHGAAGSENTEAGVRRKANGAEPAGTVVVVADDSAFLFEVDTGRETQSSIEGTLRHRRAHARAHRRDGSEWSTLTSPVQSDSYGASTGTALSILDSYDYMMPAIMTTPSVSPRSGDGRTTCVDPTRAVHSPIKESQPRHRERHRFVLPDSPQSSVFGSNPQHQQQQRRRSYSVATSGSDFDKVRPFTTNSVYGGEADNHNNNTDMFLFAGDAPTPRKSEVEGHPRLAAARPSVTTSRVGSSPRRSNTQAALSPSYPALTHNDAFTNGEFGHSLPFRQSMTWNASDTHASRPERDASGTHELHRDSGGNAEDDANGMDAARSGSDTTDGEEELDDGKAHMTCCRALALFCVHVWHTLQEWMGIRYTQDAVLRRLQQRDGLSGRAHTLLTYPVVFRRRQEAGGVRGALAGKSLGSAADAGGGEDVDGDEDAEGGGGGGADDLPYSRPYWRQPSAAMLGSAAVRGSVMPWYLHTEHRPPALVQSGVPFATQRRIDALPSSALSLFGLIERRQRAKASTSLRSTRRARAKKQVGLAPAAGAGAAPTPRPDPHASTFAAPQSSSDSPPDVPLTATTRRLLPATPATATTTTAGLPVPPTTSLRNLASLSPAALRGQCHKVSPYFEIGGESDGAGAELTMVPSMRTARSGSQCRPLQPARSALPAPLVTAQVSQEASQQAVPWADYCLAVAEGTIGGFVRFWREHGHRAPITRHGRAEERPTEPVSVVPPTNQLLDARFAELLREVILCDESESSHNDSSSDEEEQGTFSSEGGATASGSDDDQSVNSSTTGRSSGETTREGEGDDNASELSPSAARWNGQDKEASRRLAAALVRGPAPPQRAAHHRSTRRVDTGVGGPLERRLGALVHVPHVPMDASATQLSASRTVSPWQAWMSPEMNPTYDVPSLSATTNSSSSILASTARTATPAIGFATCLATRNTATDSASITERPSASQAQASDDALTWLRLLRCHFMLRERLVSVYWSQRRRLRHVQSAVNDRIGRAIRLFMAFLFLWLSVLACVALAVVFGGMLNTVDKNFIGGTHRERNDAAYQLAGYGTWDAFVSHCCCTAAQDLNASFPFYALDVESWICENGKVKERIRRDAFDEVERSGYRVRELCGMSFLNGCALHNVDDSSSGKGTAVHITGCSLTDLEDYELSRW